MLVIVGVGGGLQSTECLLVVVVVLLSLSLFPSVVNLYFKYLQESW